MAGRGKILVTGHRGQLGADLVPELAREYRVTGIDLPEVDIIDLNQVLSAVRLVRPDIVIHAAAYTDVDSCESNPEIAFAVNRDGTWNVAQACAELGARMIYYSTDYVFDGDKSTAYVESDTPGPKTAYGQSKLAGEEAVRELLEDHVIFRVAWVYGRHGRNFVKTMIKHGKQHLAEGEGAKPLRVVEDQFGNPTWTVDIVRQTEAVIEADLRGTLHATSEGETTWFRFARDIFEILNLSVPVEPCTTAEYPRLASRPARSTLENERLKQAGCHVMRGYRLALEEFLRLHGKELLDEV